MSFLRYSTSCISMYRVTGRRLELVSLLMYASFPPIIHFVASFALVLLFFASCDSHTKTAMRNQELAPYSPCRRAFQRNVTVVDHVASDAEKRSKSLLPSEIHIAVTREMIKDNYTEVSSGIWLINFNFA